MTDIEDTGPAFPPEHTPMTYSGMTPRQNAAIKLRVPNSGIDWLDAMILQSRRDELAKAAMQGELASMADPNGCGYGLAFYANDDEIKRLTRHWYRIADAMIAAGKGGAK